MCRSLHQDLLPEAEERLQQAVITAEETAQLFRKYKAKMRKLRAKQLCKRTCWVCAKTVPLSSHAFGGGCRHASIRRVDRPRYCSEACQRAHWAAGHKDECPCAKDL